MFRLVLRQKKTRNRKEKRLRDGEQVQRERDKLKGAEELIGRVSSDLALSSSLYCPVTGKYERFGCCFVHDPYGSQHGKHFKVLQPSRTCWALREGLQGHGSITLSLAIGLALQPDT